VNFLRIAARVAAEPAHEKIQMKNDEGLYEKVPIATFNDGNSHFIIDDGCYVLVNRTNDGENDYYGESAWISPEALEVLNTLPSPSKELELQLVDPDGRRFQDSNPMNEDEKQKWQDLQNEGVI
jgi:hypothetical protein